LVFQNNPRIPTATAARIRAVASEMGYDPTRNAAARRLIGLKYGQRELNHLIALGFSSDFHRYPYWTRLFYGILDALESERFGVVTAQFPSPYEITSDDLLPVIRRGEVDGIITPAGYVSFLTARGGVPELPIVSIVHHAPQTPSVVIDECTGSYLALCHLFELGHRAILHFAYPPDAQGRLGPINRLRGVHQAFREYGIAPDDALFTMLKPARWLAPLALAGDAASPETLPEDEGALRRQLAEFLVVHPEVTAIATINDADAIRVFYHLKALGIRIPEEISLIGCDDVDLLLDEERNNILTTIHMPLREVGQEAARVMLGLLRGAVEEQQTVILQPTLAIRKTTAPAHSRKVR